MRSRRGILGVSSRGWFGTDSQLPHKLTRVLFYVNRTGPSGRLTRCRSKERTEPQYWGLVLSDGKKVYNFTHIYLLTFAANRGIVSVLNL